MGGGVTVEQAASELGASKKAVYRLLRKGELEGEQAGRWMPWLIQVDSVERVREAREARGRKHG